MDQRLTAVTLGVADLAAAVAFYERLGWTPSNDWRAQDVAFFAAGGMVIGLWSRVLLAADSSAEDRGRWGGITLAHNVRSPEAVDALLDEARAAGATVAKQGEPTDWGGYHGVFHDLDGHAWEVAHNPFWPLADDGSVRLGGGL